jgi:hypothetical protein
MKKRDIKSLRLRKSSISVLGNSAKGGLEAPLTKFNCATQLNTCQTGNACTTFPVTCQTLNNLCPTFNYPCQSLVECV